METPADIKAIMNAPRRIGATEVARNNTYPYRDRRVAPWPEDDTPGRYCINSDRQGAVIRRSVSYVLWKYYEATGRRLRLFPGGGHQNDAKHWHEVMKLNKKTAVEGNFADFLNDNIVRKSCHYIGVNPEEGEFGQVYWFEGMTEDGQIYASTYFEFDYQLLEILPCELEAGYITWYRV